MRTKKQIVLYAILLILLFYLIRLQINKPHAEIEILEEELFKLELKYLKMLASTEPPSNKHLIQLHLPTIYDIYTHLKEDGDLTVLNPALRYPDRTLSKRELIIGVPTVQRKRVSYLVPTLQQLFQKARKEDLEKLRIVVMISDRDVNSNYIQETVRTLQAQFKNEFEQESLQILVPPQAWYPDIRSIPSTYNDNAERMYWRTKQNLDYAYLMIFTAPMGNLYLQLEDDLDTAPNYTESIFHQATGENWFILEFSTLGYIGKLMRTKDISSLAVHILINFAFKPIDWILEDYLGNRHCVKETKKCRRQVSPSLFQHVGYFSSLAGKIQRLKDKAFKKP